MRGALTFIAFAGAFLVILMPLLAVLDAFVTRAVGRHVSAALDDPVIIIPDFDHWVDEALDLTRDDPFPAPRQRRARLWR